MPFETLLGLIGDEADRNSLKGIADKFPALKQYVEDGERMQAIKVRAKALGYDDGDPDKAIEELSGWRKFKANDWDRWKSDFDRQQTMLMEAQARVAEMEAAGETDMTAEDIKKILQQVAAENGYMKKDEVEAALKNYGETVILPSMNGQGSKFQTIYARLTPKLFEHQQALGEAIDYEKVFEHMAKSGQTDPVKAYDEVYADKFAAKRDADYTARLEAEKLKAKEEGVQEGRKLAAAAAGVAANPVDGGTSVGGGHRMGPLQRARMDRNKGADGTIDTKDIPLGKGIGSAFAQGRREKQMAGAGQ